jgi:Rho termination factor-like protein
MTTLTELRSQVHHKLLNLRRVERIVSSVEFEVAYESCANKEDVTKLIKEDKVDDLNKWLKMEVEANVGEYTIRQLRSIASQHGVPKYSIKTKAELLMAIADIYKEKHETNTNGTQKAACESSLDKRESIVQIPQRSES